MNKKQKLIYNWLISKPSYLKKGQTWLFWNINKVTNINEYTTDDVEYALKSVKSYFKTLSSESNTDISKEVKKSLKPNKEWTKKWLDYKVELDKKPFKETPWGQKIAKFKEGGIYKKIPKSNVLVIADTHFPFCREGYLEHCLKIYNKYNCNKVVHIGDEVDLCGVSQWEKDPDGFSAGTEASLAQEQIKKWYKAFPEVLVCIGNHTARPFRMAKSNGIPKKFIKSYEDAWEAPKGWQWSEHWEIDGVLYTHGTGLSGPSAAIRVATRHRQNTVIGHIHSEAGIQYSASKIDLVWGMMVGAALDDKSYAAYYAKDQLKKSIVGCGIVLQGKLPIYEPMFL